MYVPATFHIRDRATILAFMRQYNFATLVSSDAGQLHATHLPLTVEAQGVGPDAPIILRGHLARANPQARALEAGGKHLAIFQGPHAYVSATHYTAVENVPTWNYTAVHAYVTAQTHTGQADKLGTLQALVAATEPAYQAQWDSLPQRYRDGMLNGIVAFEARVIRLEAKFKLSQNRSRADQERVADGLAASAHPDAAATGRLMKARMAAGE
jgi:transcriptional regulator